MKVDGINYLTIYYSQYCKNTAKFKFSLSVNKRNNCGYCFICFARFPRKRLQ